MNYFAHALPHLDRPYFVAGVALPDWMNIVDRRLKVRSRHAAAFVTDANPELAEFAAGVMRHHADDAWFHDQREFVETSMKLSVSLREWLPEDAGMRRGFLGHILVELLLDAFLIERQPERLEAYYNALSRCDPATIQDFVAQIAPRPTVGIAPLVPRFIAERFLYDYSDNAKLWFRLNQVMRRVGLPILPECLVDWLSTARQNVYLVAESLLPPPVT